jgi:hypothetical protein
MNVLSILSNKHSKPSLASSGIIYSTLEQNVVKYLCVRMEESAVWFDLKRFVKTMTRTESNNIHQKNASVVFL